MKYASWSNEVFSISAASSVVTEETPRGIFFLCCFFRQREKIILCGCLNFDKKKFNTEELMKGDGREDGRRRIITTAQLSMCVLSFYKGA